MNDLAKTITMTWLAGGLIAYVLYWVYYKSEAKRNRLVIDKLYFSGVFLPLICFLVLGPLSIPFVVIGKKQGAFREMVAEGKAKYNKPKRGVVQGDDVVG